MKLPDERSLAEQYNVSRSSVKRALNKMSNEGIIFKKRGSGTFINPLYLKMNLFLIMKKDQTWEFLITLG